jgi:hypothetical protein
MPDISTPHIPSCPTTFEEKRSMDENLKPTWNVSKKYFIKRRYSNQKLLGCIGWDTTVICVHEIGNTIITTH